MARDVLLAPQLSTKYYRLKAKQNHSKMLRSVSTLSRCLNFRTSKKCYSSVLTAKRKAQKAEYHCCIVGSGPAALYTAEEIKKIISHEAKIDFYERLPTPYGLIRYGVAPDHPEIKKPISDRMSHMFKTDPTINYFGNVTVGVDIRVSELRQHYDIVVLCYGASEDRQLGVPGEDLNGVYSARHFVNWYNAYPLINHSKQAIDTHDRNLQRENDFIQRIVSPDLLSNTGVYIFGNGNVAMDTARILCQDVDELKNTDISQETIEVLSQSKIREVHVVGRRGPVQAAFTTKELRDIHKMKNCRVILADELNLTEADKEELQQRPKKRQFDLLKQVAEESKSPDPSKKTVILHFLKSPLEFLPAKEDPQSIGSIVLGVNTLSGPANNQRADFSGKKEVVPAHLAFRSIGYRSINFDSDLPFDKRAGVVANLAGRVNTADLSGVYVCGWLKRGPTGIIGTNLEDAIETVNTIQSDLSSGGISKNEIKQGSAPVLDILSKRGIRVVKFEDWEKIEAEEKKRGEKFNRPYVKFTNTKDMFDVLESK